MADKEQCFPQSLRLEARRDQNGLGLFDLVMLGYGSIIGAGLFVASGMAVQQAGPAVLLVFLVGGVALVGVLTGLAEMAAANPSRGGLRSYAREALGPWFGFTVGWMYWTSGVLTMSSEVTAASLLAHLWLPHWPLWMLSLVFSALITGVNFLDARGFGKVESAFAAIKVVALLAFVGIGLFAILRGQGTGLQAAAAQGSWATALFPNGLRGMGASLLMVMFTYSGVQVMAMAAPEARDIPHNVPKAIGILSSTLILLYLVAFAVLVLLVPWNQINTQTSPFVQALQHLGLVWASPVMNLVILTAALSSLNSALFGVARMLYSLAKDHEAPGIFLRASKTGTPTWATAGSSLVLAVAIALAFWLPRDAYLLITSASGFVGMFNWTVIAVSHLRYRPILLRRDPHCLPFRAWGYPYLSLVTIGILGAVLLSAPLVRAQTVGLVVGAAQFVLVSLVYFLVIRPHERPQGGGRPAEGRVAKTKLEQRDDGRLPV